MSLAALLALSGLTALAAASASPSQAAPVQKIILDTDIGGDVDDAYALALFAALPNVKLMAVTTAYGETQKRVPLAAKLLKVMGLPGVPVAAGRSGEAKVGPQCDWAAGFR
jgi:inosine-uridine nucleoside N-ribohydrolase